MSRLTDANLDAYEADAVAEEDLLRREDVLSLVAEVRRLRGIVAGVAYRGAIAPPEKTCGCAFCGRPLISEPHAPDCPWPPLEAEAEAVRAARRTR